MNYDDFAITTALTLFIIYLYCTLSMVFYWKKQLRDIRKIDEEKDFEILLEYRTNMEMMVNSKSYKIKHYLSTWLIVPIVFLIASVWFI